MSRDRPAGGHAVQYSPKPIAVLILRYIFCAYNILASCSSPTSGGGGGGGRAGVVGGGVCVIGGGGGGGHDLKHQPVMYGLLLRELRVWSIEIE
jgi:hypothetical protein